MMEITKKQDGNDKRKRSFFELLTEIFAWVQIVVSPLLAGLVLGFIAYLFTPDTLGIILGVAFAVIGLIIGVIWATKICKNEGTVHFMSKVMATPELDKVSND
jgi:hypothetical protein